MKNKQKQNIFLILVSKFNMDFCFQIQALRLSYEGESVDEPLRVAIQLTAMKYTAAKLLVFYCSLPRRDVSSNTPL